MPLFHFTAIVDTSVIREREQLDYPTLEFAKGEARSMLMQMANERLQVGGWEMMFVEIYNDQLEPLTELRLTFQKIDK
jgi:hypothetical protein